MTLRKHILNNLSDGEFHSGQEMADDLQVTRTAIWKTIKSFAELEIDLETHPKKGYRLLHGFDFLDESKIKLGMSPQALAHLSQLEILDTIDSTNQHLLSQKTRTSGQVCLAEQQTNGRGRRGREWVSPYGTSIYLSTSWNFPSGASELAGLSLAVGVSIINALKKCGINNLGLKWPNDIVYDFKKLAGILIEMSGDVMGPCNAVIGVGVNVILPETATHKISQEAIDLSTITNKKLLRNNIVAELLNELLIALPKFQDEGLSHFIPEWNNFDVLKDGEVFIHHGDKKIEGKAVGIDPQGRLLVELDNQVKAFNSGDVSVRSKTN